MNAVVKRPCSECSEETTMREYRGTVLCLRCCVDGIDVLDEEPACACGAPNEQQCECEEQAPFDHERGYRRFTNP